MESQKAIHTLVIDTGSVIKNEPPVSTLLKQSESLITVPEVLQEIKDQATRSRVETTLRPFLTVRSPTPSSVKFVTDFARRTGDLSVLSKPDVLVIALAYEIECERNEGDWRLRRTPGQKRINGAPPVRKERSDALGAPDVHGASQAEPDKAPVGNVDDTISPSDSPADEVAESHAPHSQAEDMQQITTALQEPAVQDVDDVQMAAHEAKVDSALSLSESQRASEPESDPEGWITPANLKKRQIQDSGTSIGQAAESKTMQVGVLTTDFAMQNVILQMNLNLISPSLTRVKHLKTFVLRCHACFQTTKDMSKQFCPRCGQASLTRVSCSTNANGEFELHLKKNMQWNHRGDRYSIPKPVHGSSNGRVAGGGKCGWGNNLILAEDQKEYQRAVVQEKRTKARDLMDEDYLPSILTGDRARNGGRIKVGAGRAINSKKR